MSDCPPAAQLELLLSEQLSEAARDQVSGHVDQCVACQDELERITATPPSSADQEAELAADEPALASLIDRLRSDITALDDVVATDGSDPRAPLTLDDFDLHNRLGEGGMGVVYRATQRSLSKPVAIKVLEKVDTRDRQLVERFLREARAAASLRHPNIVDVHGVGRTNKGGYFLVMDLVDGSDLERLARAGTPIGNPAEIVAIVADAIHHAHQQGIIHRDLKPSNVLIANDGRVLVTDFGVAKVLRSEAKTLSRHAEPIGTPNYMAPEQADPRRATIGPATDVYGLGGILYFLLTGQHPYVAGEGGDIAILGQVLSGDPPIAPSELNQDVPPALERICLACLSKEQADRYQSAQALSNALRGENLGPSSAAQPADDLQTDVAALTSVAPRQVTLLYKRDAEPDGRVLRLLEEELTSDGHTVFVDRHMQIGVEWAREIERQIREADAVVVLLSAASVQSEMLTYEVQLAQQAAIGQLGTPRLLPVRVDFDDALPHELGRVLDPLQCFYWTSDSDDESLVAALRDALTASLEPNDAGPLTQLEPPLGAVPIDSEFYLLRDADSEYQAALARGDSIVLVRGARQMGKTSLMARGLKLAREAGTHVVLTDFQKLNAKDLSSAESLFLSLGDWVADRLDLDASPHDSWNEQRGASVNFERFLRREILAELSAPLVWGLDEVDRLFTCDFSSEVFGLFRSWHNERALDPSGPWSRLTLAIAYATEAHLFITDINQSPFNVGTRISLEDFSLPQVAELNRRYGSPLATRDDVERFTQLVGGQPYLVNRGLYEIVQRGWSIDDFAAQADTDEGVYGDHLRRMVVLLAHDDALRAALCGVLKSSSAPSTEHFYRLRSAGLLVGGSADDCRLRCDIYQRYLERRL